ncbi:MAG: RidA family protein [Stellaceae bacterium]
MPRHIPVAPEGLPPAIGPYARAVRVGDLLYVAGTTALSHMSGDYRTRRMPATIEGQARMTLDNIRTLVEAAGGTIADIFKLVIMLKNPADYARLNAVRAEYFPHNPPVSTCFEANLMRDDILVEIEAVAALD